MPWRDIFALRAAPPRSLPGALEAAFAMGVPVAVGVALGHQSLGLIACLGAFAALYGARLSQVRRRARLAFLVAVGLTAAMAVGKLTAPHVWTAAAGITVTAGVAVFVCLAAGVGPPGAYMFVLVCAAATHLPPGHTGRDTALVAAGAAGAALIATAGTAIAPLPSGPAAAGAPPGAGPDGDGSAPAPGLWGWLRAGLTGTFGHHSPVAPAAGRAALPACTPPRRSAGAWTAPGARSSGRCWRRRCSRWTRTRRRSSWP
jgi:hypothetical protein